MGEELKSAYELAMERLQRKDTDSGKAAPAVLSQGQKKEIAAIRREYDAKLAEREILYRAECESAAAEPEKLEVIQDSYRRDREFLTSQMDARINQVKMGKV
jgi:hypothetical protein